MADSQGCDPLQRALRDEARRLANRARLPVFVTLMAVPLATALAGQFRLLPGNWAFAALWVGLAGAVLPFNMAVSYLMVRPLKSAREITAFVLASGRRTWAEIDGNPEIPLEPEAILSRIGDRTDDRAMFCRIAAFTMAGDWDAGHAALDTWQPREPGDIANKARIAEQLSFYETGRDDIASVLPIASAVPDEGTRKRLMAYLSTQQACRRAARGEPMLSDLKAARLELGELEYPYLRLREQPWFVDLIFAFLIGVGAVITIGIAVFLSQALALAS